MAKKQQTLEEWWEEDAERLNRIAKAVSDAGYAVGDPADSEPPELNPDGSLAEVGDEEDEDEAAEPDDDEGEEEEE